MLTEKLPRAFDLNPPRSLVSHFNNQILKVLAEGLRISNVLAQFLKCAKARDPDELIYSDASQFKSGKLLLKAQRRLALRRQALTT